MTTYYASARSNYFKVKNPAAFAKALKPYNVRIVAGRNGHKGKVSLQCTGENSWDWCDYDNDTEKSAVEIIAPHLKKGEVCILMETGAESLRFIVGRAEAFDHTGKYTQIRLQEIYAKAAETFKGSNITLAEV